MQLKGSDQRFKAFWRRCFANIVTLSLKKARRPPPLRAELSCSAQHSGTLLLHRTKPPPWPDRSPVVKGINAFLSWSLSLYSQIVYRCIFSARPGRRTMKISHRAYPYSGKCTDDSDNQFFVLSRYPMGE